MTGERGPLAICGTDRPRMIGRSQCTTVVPSRCWAPSPWSCEGRCLTSGCRYAIRERLFRALALRSRKSEPRSLALQHRISLADVSMLAWQAALTTLRPRLWMPLADWAERARQECLPGT